MSGPTTQSRSVRRTASLPATSPGGGFDRSVSLNAAAIGDDLSPFVDLTLFDMSLPVFRPHAHAGFSAVTYMLEESPGSFRNRWTFGDDEIIGPGAIHWTRAGAGMMHEEVPTVSGLTCRGIQMFVKLPAERELDPPQAFHLDSEQVREVSNGRGARVRVLAGSVDETPSELGLADEVLYLDVHLDAGARVALPAPKGWNAFVFVLRGALDVGGVQLIGPAAATYEDDHDSVVVEASTAAHVVFGAGPPLGAFVARGSFIMSTREQLDAAERRFVAGEMGFLRPSF